jgi:hypothetical protein
MSPDRRPPGSGPVIGGSNIHYDVAGRTVATGVGGIGSVHLLARQVGLVDAIDSNLHLLKVHLPYHESDHVLNIAYNVMCGGDCLQDIDLLRGDEAYLDGLGAQRVPDPTTAGDFCRRFESARQVNTLTDAINSVRAGVWERQDAAFLERAVIDVDGTVAPTTGECKQGMDMHHDGQWGYHPLIVSLSNTKEPLYILNRPASRPSHEEAAGYLNKAIDLCLGAGFESVLLRGDTDFSQTAYLDGWDDRGVKFLFGIDAMPNLKATAEALEKSAWQPLARPARYDVATRERARPDNVKQAVVVEREYEDRRQRCEHVAEVDYQPTKCGRSYRLIICRKTIDVTKGQNYLFEMYRYFFYISNDRPTPKEQLVFGANKRCDQENLIEQLKNGVHAMSLPSNTLISNWAYMVMASLAWSLKAWWGLCLPPARGPAGGPAKQKREQQKQSIVTMEFKRFVAGVIRLPCQVIRTGRRIVCRLLSYGPWHEPLLSAVAAWRTRSTC